jgi:hypothetical protein
MHSIREFVMKTCIQVVALLLFAGSASAGDTGFYIGGGVGKATTDFPGASDTDTAFQIFGGYSINKNLSVEVSYLDLGEVTTDTDSASTTGMAVSLLGMAPLQGNFALFGRFGMANMDTKWDVGEDSRSDLTWGVGGQLDYSPESSFRLEYNSYAVGDKNDADGDSSAITLSVLFHL